eukprot:4335836-Pyramimonas_sp.AAC.1
MAPKRPREAPKRPHYGWAGGDTRRVKNFRANSCKIPVPYRYGSRLGCQIFEAAQLPREGTQIHWRRSQQRCCP